MIRFHYIYKTTRIDTGEYYIGMRSSRVRPEEDSYLGSGLRLRAAVKRHGRESFSKMILIQGIQGREALAKVERWAITTVHVKDPLCYNMTTGGGGNPRVVRGSGRTPEGQMRVNAAVSAAHLGVPSNRLGKKCTKEQIERFREAANRLHKERPEVREKIRATIKAMCAELGADSPLRKHVAAHGGSQSGKQFSDEHRRKIAEANTGRLHSEETKKKLSRLRKGLKRSPEALAKQSVSMAAFHARRRASKLIEEVQ